MSELTEWDSFYVIVGSASGALIGLQFVVMMLCVGVHILDAVLTSCISQRVFPPRKHTGPSSSEGIFCCLRRYSPFHQTVHPLLG